VVAFAGADMGATEKGIFGAGGQITGEEPMGDHMELFVTAPLANVNALAAVPGVQFIEAAPEIEARNVSTRWIVQSNVPNQTPLYAHGIHGEGQVLGHLDDGFRSTHCSFNDTNPIGPTHRKILRSTGPCRTPPTARTPPASPWATRAWTRPRRAASPTWPRW